MAFFSKENLKSLRKRFARLLAKIQRRVPPGARLVLGLMLIVGGVLGFLPVVGFWMLPLGIGVVWLDYRSLKRFLNRRQR